MSASFSFARVAAILIKEFQQMLRERLTFAMSIGVPVMQLILFGYAINNDPKGLPTAVVAADAGPQARSLVAALQNSGYFKLVHQGTSPAEADALMEQFAKVVKQDVKAVYVGHVEGAATAGHHLAWHAVKEGGMIGTEKVLEFAFERLAWHGAGAAVSAASLPLLAFSTAMFFHEIAASEMNNLVCLKWGHYYKGSYANVAGSLHKMTAKIK